VLCDGGICADALLVHERDEVGFTQEERGRGVPAFQGQAAGDEGLALLMNKQTK
jgi:hypothetical protein